MGTCCSSNENRLVKAGNVYNRKKKSSNCLNSICNSESNKDLKNQEPKIIKKHKNVASSYNINHKEGSINEFINVLIEKYKADIPIKKINYIQLYNIFMNFEYDFNESDYIVYDTRKDSLEKKENFLKKFRQINYSTEQIHDMQGERLNKFKNFLNNKIIIFILKDDYSFEALEQFLSFFHSKKNIHIKNIYILTESIIHNEENNMKSIYNNNLYTYIDEDALYEYSPKILINSSDIKCNELNYDNNSENYAFAFITKYPHLANIKAKEKNNKNEINKLCINYICNKDLEDNDIFLNFFAKFNINYILNFISEEKPLEQNSKLISKFKQTERKKINNEKNKIPIGQTNISIPKNIGFDEFYNNIKNDFGSIIDEIKEEFIENNCIIFEFDDDIDELIKIKLIFIICYKITGLSFENIENYLKDNFFDLNFNNYQLNKDEMNHFLN